MWIHLFCADHQASPTEYKLHQSFGGIKGGQQGKNQWVLEPFVQLYVQFACICPVPSGHQTNYAIATHLAIPVGDFSV